MMLPLGATRTALPGTGDGGAWAGSVVGVLIGSGVGVVSGVWAAKTALLHMASSTSVIRNVWLAFLKDLFHLAVFMRPSNLDLNKNRVDCLMCLKPLEA